VVQRAKGFDLTVLHTSTPSLRNDVKTAERLKDAYPAMQIGFVGAHTMVLPEQTLHASTAIDFVTTGEFDYPLEEIAEGHPFDRVSEICRKFSFTSPVGYNLPR
jgi:hypothetical protein